jgi:hypothetical protein
MSGVRNWFDRRGSGLRAAFDRCVWRLRPGRNDVGDRISLRRFPVVTTDPPPMHWAPCHPSSIRRFKASVTCPNGHGLTLRGHAISQSGDVSPSVVCPVEGCSFHRFVRLDRWSFGAVP